jgi:hypothetical protein
MQVVLPVCERRMNARRVVKIYDSGGALATTNPDRAVSGGESVARMPRKSHRALDRSRVVPGLRNISAPSDP